MKTLQMILYQPEYVRQDKVKAETHTTYTYNTFPHTYIQLRTVHKQQHTTRTGNIPGFLIVCMSKCLSTNPCEQANFKIAEYRLFMYRGKHIVEKAGYGHVY